MTEANLESGARLRRVGAGEDLESEKSGNARGFLFPCKRGILLGPLGISSVDARPFRREFEAQWRERVNRARSRNEEKLAIRRQMVGERLEWPISLAPDPDGRFALNQALKEESAARTEYMRLLRIYAGLILHGTPPEEEPGS